MTTLTLYTRTDCHLCVEMLRQLSALQGELKFALEMRDVDSNPKWFERYNEWVPVLEFDDKEICHHHLDQSALLKALEY